MSRAKAQGTSFETLIVTALQEHLGDGVCREYHPNPYRNGADQ